MLEINSTTLIIALVTGFSTYVTGYQLGYERAMEKVKENCPYKEDDEIE